MISVKYIVFDLWRDLFYQKKTYEEIYIDKVKWQEFFYFNILENSIKVSSLYMFTNILRNMN